MFDPQRELSVHRLYAEYAHRVDDGDLRGWSLLFAEDGVMSIRGAEHAGPSALHALMASGREEGVRSLGRHLIMNVEVTSIENGVATAEADFLHVVAGSGGAYIEMIGRYASRMTWVDELWKFARHEVRLLVDKRNPEVPSG